MIFRNLICLVSLWCFVPGVASWAMADDPSAALARHGFHGGWVVHVGTSDGAAEAQLSTLPRVVVTGLAYSGESAATARAALSEAGLLGSVSVHEVLDAGRLPFHDRAVAAVIADPAALGDAWVGQAEALRVLRPGGIALLREGGQWKAHVKPADDRLDDWTHYNYDATGNDASTDRLVGPGRSVRWLGGDSNTHGTKFGLRSSNGIVVTIDELHMQRNPSPFTGKLVARDGFSGTVLWVKPDIGIRNRWGLFAEGNTLYLHALEKDERYRGAQIDKTDEQGKPVLDENGRPVRIWNPAPRPMKAYDLRTGEELRTFTEGLKPPTQHGRYRHDPAVLFAAAADGKLVQCFDDELAVLDARTGERLWGFSSDGKPMIRPVVLGDRLYVLRGEAYWAERIGYFDGTPSIRLGSLLCFDLASGRKIYEATPPSFTTHAGINFMAGQDDALALFVFETPADPNSHQVTFAHAREGRLLVLNAEDGSERWHQDVGTTGALRRGGHFVRPTIHKGRAWLTGASGGRGWNLADGTDEVASLATVFRCSTSRFADDWLIGSQRFTKVTQDQHFFTEAFRTNCDVGLFPANGMVYADSTRCECLEFIRSHGGFAADRLPAEPWAGERLHRGPAKAAAAEVDAAVPGKQWPMFMHDGARSNWTDARLPAGDRIAWKVGYEPPARLPLVWREARRHEFIKQPVTAPVVAAGLVVTADSHRGIVRAMAPEDGSTRWRFVADGRIDTPPTIHGGAVYFATRTGWVYAVDREGGKLIWRYFAPPHPNLILDHAQAESTWPAFGSLVVADGLVWACVGRNAELDHGLTFVGLDPASGEPRVRRVMAEQQDWHKDYGDGSVVDTWRRRNGRMLAPNAPLLTDGDAVLTGWFGVTTEGEPANIAQDGEGRLRRVTRPGSVNSILAPRDSGRSKPAYGHAAGIVQAFNGDDVFVVDKNFRLSFDRITDWEPSERNPDADKTERRWSARLPSIRNIRGEGLLDFPGPATVLVRTADGLLTGNAWMPQLELRRIDDGSVLRTMTLPAPPVQHGVAVVDGMVVVTCDDGSVVAFK